MKKILNSALTLLLAISLIGSMAACGNTAAPGSSPSSESAASKPSVSAYDVEDSADVVIIGGGGAGMSAALTAVENGAEKVIIVEKLPVLGGFMRLKTGQFSAPDTTLQREQGLTEDSVERYKAEILKFGNLHGGHPIEYIVDTYANNAQEAWEWVYEMGVKDYEFKTDAEGNKVIINPGHMPYEYKRTYIPQPKPDSTIANPVVEVMQNKIENEPKIKVYTQVEGRKLLTNEKGQVCGAEGLGTDGKTYKFNTKKGVIMSTGGYAANPKLFEKYSTDLTNLLSAALSSDDGYGLRMMQELGAGITEEAMSWIETYPKGMSTEASATSGVNGSTGTYYTGGILVNINGERFINECAWDDEVRNAGLKAQPDCFMFEIYTDKIFEDTKGTMRGMYDYFAEGGTYHSRVVSADSLKELAEKIGVPADTLITTVEKYNQAVDSGKPDEFGREFVKKPGENRVETVNKIEGDKYYALKLQPIVLSSRGGITINELNQVTAADGVVIPGLYAAGEVVGQMWGKTIAPGVGMNGALTFGRYAAKNIMTLDMPESYTVKPADNMFDLSLFEKEKSDAATEVFSLEGLKDGTYKGSAKGMNGDVTVEVSVADSKIASIKIVEHTESAGIADPAIEKIPSAIVEQQKIEVDAVSTATITSNAIKSAVVNVLKQAK